MKDDLNVIASLGDNPNTDNGLSARELKAMFDKAPLALQKFINETVVPAINTYVSDGAPAGYGLGGAEAKEIADIDAIVLPGFYKFSEPITIDGAVLYAPYLRVAGRDESFCTQWLCPDGDDGTQLRRTLHGGAWQPWEWENPPMVLGTEYRTTERWNGRPVYIKLIDAGIIATSKEVNIGVYGVSTGGVHGIIRHYAFTNTGRVALSGGTTPNAWQVAAHIDYGVLSVNAGAGVAGNSETLYVQIWYI